MASFPEVRGLPTEEEGCRILRVKIFAGIGLAKKDILGASLLVPEIIHYINITMVAIATFYFLVCSVVRVKWRLVLCIPGVWLIVL
ncbi:hypothetical protein scyTo_0015961 [Scyliorhinus torazame]|uniref:Uncharacterized protein n=1 Tax=Scyliorhinus torazame TaxID=75743 RepID=A0A401Q1U4_SCYTO|nr:hypothetical protein [Scyliorhinus torazame]